FAGNLTVSNADIEGQAVGVQAPVQTGGTATTVAGSYFSNQVDVLVNTMWTVVESSDWMAPKALVLRNDRFGLAAPGATAVAMAYPDPTVLGYIGANLIQRDQVFVYDYDGVAGDSFQVFYAEQAANYIVPAATYNEDGTVHRTGAPVAGLTNQQAWAQYGVAIAGAVAPASATTRSGIDGLVNPI